MNQKEGRILQNIKTDHFRQLFNQQSSSGTFPKASDQKKIIFFWTKILKKMSKNSIFGGCNLRQWKSKVQK